MSNKIIFKLSMNLSVLDASMCCEESLYLVCIVFGSTISSFEMYRKFAGISRSASMIMLCKMMQNVIIFHRTCGFLPDVIICHCIFPRCRYSCVGRTSIGKHSNFGETLHQWARIDIHDALLLSLNQSSCFSTALAMVRKKLVCIRNCRRNTSSDRLDSGLNNISLVCHGPPLYLD